MNKRNFIYWLRNNRNIVSYSVKRYANAIDTISSELESYGMARENLYNITDTAIIDMILDNPEFQQKNKKGNRMYSSSLNHYKKFIEYLIDMQFQAELMKDQIEYKSDIRSNISTEKKVIDIVDTIQDRPSHKIVNNRKIWSRNSRYASDVIVDANYLCEYDSQHNHFVSKFSQKNYVEAHHLIPMKFQEQFDFSLDIYANIVSLCLVCHKKLHYGIYKYKKPLLDKLFQERQERLINSGINISITQLYSFYED